MMEKVIEVSHLTKEYKNLKAIDDLSFNVYQGEILGLLGPNGCGKSTTINSILSLLKYQEGSIKVFGKEMKPDSYDLKAKIGVIFQEVAVFEELNVYDNIALPLKFWKQDPHSLENKQRIEKLLKLVGLENKSQAYPRQLSGGQKQRVAIARALALNPKILLCDEATSALDPKTTKDILALLNKINKELGITIVVVTHQMEVVKEICEKVALLEDGILVAKGAVEEVFLKPGISIKKFLGEEENDTLPRSGVNIRILFPSKCSESAIITKMARELAIDFSIVGGKLEKFREDVLGSLVINIDESQKDTVLSYLQDKDIILEVLK